MKKSFGYLASLLSAIVTGATTLVLVGIIIGQAVLLKDLSDHRALLEIGLNVSIFIITLLTFILSLFCVKLQKDKEYLSSFKNRKLVYATMVFDYILSFLFFTYCLIEDNALVIALYVLCLILMALAGSFFLIETNQYFKEKKKILENNFVENKEEKIEIRK